MCCRPQVVYVGDGNNITHSWLRLAAKLDLQIVCACPEGFEPDQATLELANAGAGQASVSHDVMEVRLHSPHPYGHTVPLLLCQRAVALERPMQAPGRPASHAMSWRCKHMASVVHDVMQVPSC